MGGFFSSGDADKTQQESTSSTQLPAWLNQRYQTLGSRAENISNTAFQQPVQQIAGFTPDQMAAFGATREAQNGWQPFLNQAETYANLGASPITTQSIMDAYNPYIDARVQKQQNAFNYQNQQEMEGVESDIAKQNAVTGDRGFVAKQLAKESQAARQDPQIAAIMQQGFSEAAGLAQGNRSAYQQGASQFANLGAQNQQQTYADIGQLFGQGSFQQAHNQAGLDANYNWQMAKLAYPFESAQWLAGIYGGLAPGAGSTTSSSGTTTQPSPSPWSQMLGLGATAAGAYMASDERVKENITQIGEDHAGMPIYRYNYVGEDPANVQIGYIAQEVEKTHPEAVATGPDGVKQVNYNLATAPAAQHHDPEVHRLHSNLGSAVGAIRELANGGAADFMRGHAQGHAEGGKVATQKLTEKHETENRGRDADQKSKDAARSAQDAATAQSELQKALKAAQAATQQMTDATTKAETLASGGVPSAGGSPLSYVPRSEIQAGGITPSQAPQMAAPQRQQDSGLSAGFSTLGKGLGAWAAREPGIGMPSQDSWNKGTSVTAYAPGGFVGRRDTLGQLTAAPQAEEAPSAPPSFAVPFRTPARHSVVPGASIEGGDEDIGTSSYVPKSTPATPVPAPAATPEPALPEVQAVGSMEPSSATADDMGWQTTTTKAETPEGKAWYEYGSDPQMGRALMAAGAGMLSSTSPHASVGLGRGLAMGINSWMDERSAERAAAQKEKEAEARAAALSQQISQFNQQHALNRDQLEESSRHNRAMENKRPEYQPTADIQNFEYAKQNGFAGSFDEWRKLNKPDGIPNAIQVDATKADTAYNILSQGLDEYEKLVAGTVSGVQQKDANGQPIEGTGPAMMVGEDKDAILRHRRNLQLQLKELYNLGVLNGPDLSLMNEMLFDPTIGVDTKWGIPYVSGLTNAWDTRNRARRSISDVKSMLKTIRDERVKAAHPTDKSGNPADPTAAPSGSPRPTGIIADGYEKYSDGQWYPKDAQ
jgi:hypothetical protein